MTAAEVLVQSPHSVEAFDFLVPIIERWDRGFYTRSEIASYAPGKLPAWEQDYRARRRQRR